MTSTHSRLSRRGFNLIEVAIALVIFVIGALAIIRIFPGALSVIGNNGNQQMATNLNRSALARMKSEGGVPYATFNIGVNNDDSLQWTTANNTNHSPDFASINASVVGVPRFNNSLPTPEDLNTGANTSGLSRFRGIQGETAKVITFSGSTDQYILTQFPISLAKINNGAKATLLQPTISQEYVVQNARIDQQKNVTFKDATITDVNGNTIRLDAATDPKDVAKNNVSAGSTLYVSYRYFGSASKVWGVSDEALPISSATYTPTSSTNLTDATLKVSPPTTTPGAAVDYSSLNPTTTGTISELIDVRVKRYVGVGAFGDSSAPAPGSPDYPNTAQIGDARVGLIRINPAVSTDTVKVDYIADWSFLLQEGNPSTPPLITVDSGYPAIPPALTNASYRQIALGAPFIEDQAPFGVYSLLIDSGAAYKSGFGTVVTDPVANNRLVRPQQPQQREDELRSGKATFIVENSAAIARVAYQTRDNWVQQLSVAANTYKPFVVGNAEPWRDYYLNSKDNKLFLYFHAGEAGKSISISYSIQDGAAVRRFDNRLFVIEPQQIEAGGLVPTGFIQNFSDPKGAAPLIAQVQLTNAVGDTLIPTDLISIHAIRGSSVTARTAYVNGTKYVQNLLTSTRGAN